MLVLEIKIIKIARNPYLNNKIIKKTDVLMLTTYLFLNMDSICDKTNTCSVFAYSLSSGHLCFNKWGSDLFAVPRIGREMQIRPAVSRRFHPFWSKWICFIALAFYYLIMTHLFVGWLHLWFIIHLCVNEAIFTMPLNIRNTGTAQRRGGRLGRRYKRESRWNPAILF